MISRINNLSFNPIGYEAQTQSGNKYKKSNIWKSVAIANIAATFTIPPLIKSPFYRMWAESALFTPKYLYNVLQNMSKKTLPQKYKMPLLFAFGLLNVGITLTGGYLLDKITNVKRAQKADKLNVKD